LERNRILTPEEELAEKLKRQRLQEQSDLELAKEAFGNTKKPLNNCSICVLFLFVLSSPIKFGVTICSTTLSTMCYLIYQTECSFFRFSPSIYVNIH
jgi:hypothetical protein